MCFDDNCNKLNYIFAYLLQNTLHLCLNFDASLEILTFCND